MKTPSLKINPAQETNNITNFIQSTFTNSKHKNVIIGLSGGIDSLTAYFLLKQSLPDKNIFKVYLPYFDTPENPFSDLSPLTESNFLKINIKKIVDQTALTLNIRSTDKDQLRMGNIMARVRMIILYDLAKKNQALVCGTENKTEKLLGYFTRFGDEASDLEPIQHLYKTQVYDLARYLNVPKSFLSKAPSANLWPGQTDEGEFGFSYQEADVVLNMYVDQKYSVEKIRSLGFNNVEKIITMMENNQFKHQVPYHI